MFTTGSRRACQTIFIFNDDIFEITERFTAVASGILLPDGSEVPSLLGVTIDPAETEVLILDNDGKQYISTTFRTQTLLLRFIWNLRESVLQLLAYFF